MERRFLLASCCAAKSPSSFERSPSMTSHKRTLPADLALSDPTRPPASRRRALASSLYDPVTSPWTAQTALQAHHSCVNALSFSKHDGGRYLASGGDDKRVLLWDTARPDQDGDDTQGIAAEPLGCYRGATVSSVKLRKLDGQG